MPTHAQIEANRRNARRSTGPRTPEGKAVASQNAVTHGLLSSQAVCPGEDPAEFDAFMAEVLADQRPRGAVQRMIVIRIAHLQWKLARVPYIESASLVRRGDFNRRMRDKDYPMRRNEPPPGSAETISMNSEFFTGLQVYEQRLERSLRACLKELRDLQKHAEAREEDEEAIKPPEPVVVTAPIDHAATEVADSPAPVEQTTVPIATERSCDSASTVTIEESATSVAASSAIGDLNKRTQFEPKSVADQDLCDVSDPPAASVEERGLVAHATNTNLEGKPDSTVEPSPSSP